MPLPSITHEQFDQLKSQILEMFDVVKTVLAAAF